MASEKFKDLENRLEKIEYLAYGTRENSDPDEEVINRLEGLQQLIKSAQSSKNVVKEVYTKLPDLEEMMDPKYAARILPIEECKLAIIASEKDRIMNTISKLEVIDKFKAVLDSEHIKSIPNEMQKLEALADVTYDQYLMTETQQNQLNKLLQQYNIIAKQISDQFLHWDELLRNREVPAS